MIYSIHHQNGQTLFESHAQSFKQCVENAIYDGINLSYAQLSGKDLSSASLDGGLFSYANFKGSNLMDTNMSECDLTHTDLTSASLISTCLAESYLDNTIMISARFGATDITSATMKQTLFSSLSTFDLNFACAKKIISCVYILPDERQVRFSSAPVVLIGLQATPIVRLDNTIIDFEKGYDEMIDHRTHGLTTVS